MRLVGDATSILDFTANANTIEYNGADQTIINPVSPTPGYYNLTLSGNGVKAMPVSALYIAGSFSLSGTASATTLEDVSIDGDMSIASGCNLAVSPTSGLTVSGILTNNSGNTGFVLQSDATGTASLIHSTYNVPATVQRYISGAAEDWHFLSSPVVLQEISGSWTPSGTYGNGTGYDLYLWNEPNNCWIYNLDLTSAINWNTVHPGNDFMVGRGYLYSVQALNPTKEFAGGLNNGPLDYELTIGSSNATLKGFNLVGNPYPSSVDWSSASGWTRSGLVSTGGGYDMWIWNPEANNYGVINSNDADGTGTNSVTRYIAPTQGYFVRAADAGNLSMNNDVRVSDGAGNWFKSTKQEVNKVSVCVKSDAGYGSDEIQLKFGNSDNENGAMKLFSKVLTAPSLYLSAEKNDLSVLYLTNVEENPSIPLTFIPGINGSYTVHCNFDPGKFETVTLEDRQTNGLINMKITNSYRFNALKTDDANRFVLHFGEEINEPDKELPANIYSDGIKLVIDLTLVKKETDIVVYDILGRKILQQKLEGETLHHLDMNTNAQIIIVKMKNADGNLCRKLLWGR